MCVGQAGLWGSADAVALAPKPGSVSSHTALAYFAEYCKLFSYDYAGPVSADPIEFPPADVPRRGRLYHVAEYLIARLPHVQADTISTYVSTIAAHVDKCTGRPLFHCAMLPALLKRHGQLSPKPTKARLPVNKAVVAAIAADVSLDTAVRLACLLAFLGLWRVSEYVSTSPSSATEFVMRRSDFVLRPDLACGPSYAYRIRRSKTDAAMRAPEYFFVPQPGDSHCPVRNLTAYLRSFDARGLPPDSPLFTKLNGSFVVRADIDAALKKHAPAFGFPADQVSSHSLRYGGAFELRDNNAPWQDILAAGRWKLGADVAMAVMYAKFSAKRQLATSARLRIDGSVPATVLPVRF